MVAVLGTASRRQLNPARPAEISLRHLYRFRSETENLDPSWNTHSPREQARTLRDVLARADGASADRAQEDIDQFEICHFGRRRNAAGQSPGQ
jgi:hypothetical protein